MESIEEKYRVLPAIKVYRDAFDQNPSFSDLQSILSMRAAKLLEYLKDLEDEGFVDALKTSHGRVYKVNFQAD
jgi:hypothetical protein